jgi:hypothetical protein
MYMKLISTSIFLVETTAFCKTMPYYLSTRGQKTSQDFAALTLGGKVL